MISITKGDWSQWFLQAQFIRPTLMDLEPATPRTRSEHFSIELPISCYSGIYSCRPTSYGARLFLVLRFYFILTPKMRFFNMAFNSWRSLDLQVGPEDHSEGDVSYSLLILWSIFCSDEAPDGRCDWVAELKHEPTTFIWRESITYHHYVEELPATTGYRPSREKCEELNW